MSFEVNNYLATIAVFLWIGFVAAISFMESWLKFKAPGVNIQIGLGIGRLVFSALNKVEWFFATVIFCSFFIFKVTPIKINNLFFYVPTILLLLQTVWLLPSLDHRAKAKIEGAPASTPSPLHLYFVVFEVLKVSSLLFFGFKQFN
ncbi:MAG: hypothetical protein JSU07_06150 [Bacteroidetes bacterium]|nr:hypothetical protein [Bacteroidota bacterium]